MRKFSILAGAVTLCLSVPLLAQWPPSGDQVAAEAMARAQAEKARNDRIVEQQRQAETRARAQASPTPSQSPGPSPSPSPSPSASPR